MSQIRAESPTAVTSAASPTGRDRARQITVTLGEVFCVLGTLVGVGVLGERVAESSGGALAADATLLAPAGPAFSIWTPIYLGLLGYTIWQWLPRQATALRQRRVGLLAAASMVLNASWLLVTQQGWLWASVAVIVALLAVLTLLMVTLHRTRPTDGGWVEPLLLDATFGAYLGWVAVATCANVTATMVESGLDPDGALADTAAVAVLAVVALVGAFVARQLGGRISIAAASVWGLLWIVVGRTTDDPRSLPTAVAAAVAALVIVGATVHFRRGRTPAA